MPVTTYVALIIRDENGTWLTGQPVTGRILETSDDYATVTQACRRYRTFTYRHRVTGEQRVLSEADVAVPGCPKDLYQWLGGCEVVATGGDAIPIREADLVHYTPTPPATR